MMLEGDQSPAPSLELFGLELGSVEEEESRWILQKNVKILTNM